MSNADARHPTRTTRGADLGLASQIHFFIPSLKLDNKGRIEKGRDADFVIVNKENLDIDMVIAKGKIVVKDGKASIKATFE